MIHIIRAAYRRLVGFLYNYLAPRLEWKRNPSPGAAPLEPTVDLPGEEHVWTVGRHVPGGHGRTSENVLIDFLKNVVGELAGNVPLLSSAFSVLWTSVEATLEEQLDTFYNELRNEERAEFALELKDQFKGLAQEFREYCKMAMTDPQKRDQFNKVNTLITLLRSRLVQSEKYEAIRDGLVDYKALPLLVALGTFELVARRQELDHYRELFKADNPSEQEKMKKLRDILNTYRDECAERVRAVMAWRDGFIKQDSRYDCENFTSTYWYRAWDEHDTRFSIGQLKLHTRIFWWTSDSNPEAFFEVEAAYCAHRSSVLTKLSQELWAMTAPARAWQYADPVNPGRTADYEWSPLYGTQADGSTPFEDTPNGRPITSIEVGTHEGRVGSLELGYLFAPAGVHGWDYVRDREAQRETSRLVLATADRAKELQTRGAVLAE
ncbi:hypothetical protein Agub_g3837, partial [Astrephomene gubernaculifera]